MMFPFFGPSDVVTNLGGKESFRGRFAQFVKVLIPVERCDLMHHYLGEQSHPCHRCDWRSWLVCSNRILRGMSSGGIGFCQSGFRPQFRSVQCSASIRGQ